ncbi:MULTISPECIES: endonuclease/exonuclease/phosphatase family protein [unclassified Bifidobacterium]|uniref:endonuclease/exonuclease/phosphatase family protein n=1 Tax=unclassified Bifidobacterium TaxID=2608897 RepID=UPI0023F67109|nr:MULTISPECIES: endonuclease/exonuclease/phosphatase family protein [unclassified Bifidobacterium]WEV66158.1 endonuclease/exonuclease/phosphatase family protein [Bifidobacterium sp. ESL0764]WEV75055.1 endonuclease/exonuclease/phosphatase family protein [Bifidobacterium sp. ESL0800]
MSKRTAKSKAKPKPAPKAKKRGGFLRAIVALLAWLCLLVALLGTFSRELPEELQSLPYVPAVAAFTPWFALLALLALLLALVSRRWMAALLAIACLGFQGWRQYPYFVAQTHLDAAAISAVGENHADIHDSYARVMTVNVYKGRASAKAIVDAVRDQRVEVLALQETTKPFVRALSAEGIDEYLPYSQISSSDGKYGNALFSATALDSPADDDVDSSASFMPGGTVSFAGGKMPVRFVSVHTTSPKPGYWTQWHASLDDVATMRSHKHTRYVLMGDFNATTDHTPLRNILGSRFHDAAQSSGSGFVFTWPANRPGLPKFAGIDHIVLDRGIVAGQVGTVAIPGSDHAALLATIAVK